MRQVILKLRLVNLAIKGWNKGSFGEMNSRIEVARIRLQQAQDDMALHGFSKALFQEELDPHDQLDKELNRQNSLLKEKC